MDEKKIDALFNESIIEGTGDFEKELQKRISRVIYIKALKVVIVFSLVVVSSFFAFSYIKTATYYNPYNEEKFLKNNDAEEASEFHCLMQTYIEMEYPGLSYVWGEVSKEGFGKYKVEAQIENIQNRYIYGDKPNTIFKIQNSKLELESFSGPHLAREIYEFRDYRNKEFFEGGYDLAKEGLQDIRGLPESAIIQTSISFNKGKSFQEYIDMLNKYEYLNPDWIAFGEEEGGTYGVSFGMCWNATSLYSLDERYPNFYGMDNKLSTASMKQQYMSQLQLLLDHSDFLNAVSFSNPSIYNTLERRYEKAANDDLEVIGLHLVLKKNDFLEFIEKENIDYFGIQDIKLSTYQKN